MNGNFSIVRTEKDCFSLLLTVLYMPIPRKSGAIMRHIQWNDLYLIGNKLIDLQHKKLFEIADRLYMLLQQTSHSKTDLKDILDDLSDYVKYHFNCEESLMEEIHYPFIRSHKQQHQKITERITANIQDFENGIDIDSEQLYLFVSQWLIDHIMLIDKQVALYVKKKQ